MGLGRKYSKLQTYPLFNSNNSDLIEKLQCDLQTYIQLKGTRKARTFDNTESYTYALQTITQQIIYTHFKAEKYGKLHIEIVRNATQYPFVYTQ